MNLIDYLGERAGIPSGVMPNEENAPLDPGWGSGLGMMAPGVITDVGGNHSMMARIPTPNMSGVSVGHGAIVIVGSILVGLAVFHYWTRAQQK